MRALLVAVAASTGFGLALGEDDAAGRAGFERELRPLVEDHCLGCHAGAEAEAALDLEAWIADADAADAARTLGRVRDVLRDGLMPPARRPQPEPARTARALGWIDVRLVVLRSRVETADPGRVPLRRLNAAEYERSVRDLFGIDYDARSLFPADGAAEGFDTVGDALSLSEARLEKYLLAAERIAAEAVSLPDPDAVPVRRLSDERLRLPPKVRRHEWGYGLSTNGEISGDVEVARSADFLVRARAWAQQAGPEPARMDLRVDGARLAGFDVLAERDGPQVVEARVRLARGTRRVGAAFVNDYFDPEFEDPARRDRNLHVDWIEVVGPIGGAPPTEFQERFLSEAAAAAPERSLEELARRVWRRPPEHGDVERLLALSGREDPWRERLRLALTAVLASPRFLYRPELEGGLRDLDDYELAARLAAFLWSSTPDEPLLEAAREGALGDAARLRAEVARMLRDPRSSALAERFAGQWLQTEGLDRAAPDPARFPAFDEELRAAMKAETELFFEAILREDRPVRELLDADFTFVNERLADHYGIPGVRGGHMRRVRLAGALREARAGLFGQAGVLTVTSTPTRTSPVKRGKWVLETLLDDAPPPPPPGNDSIDESPAAVESASLRERLEEHRARAECAVCHARMDPMGFALERFDAVGALREEADGFAIDDGARLPDGRRVEGVAGLRALLVDDPAFVRTLARKLATFALGRALGERDELAFDVLLDSLEGREPTLADLIQGVVRLPAFRRQGAEPTVAEELAR